MSDDHHAVSEILKQLLTALHNKDVEVSHFKLDLLWARLAVHIRAEHLHLFPAVVSEFAAAESIIVHLRADHDFFMRELARAIGVLRVLPKSIIETSDNAKLATVSDTIREIERRLVSHDDIEEHQIYSLASTMLTTTEHMKLAKRIQTELENRPPRFSEEAWANSL
jgi:hemerythrin superfamily protein